MQTQNTVPMKPNRDESLLQVQSIFYTIQGECIFAGMPAVFIRLTGCNLQCTFCDTRWNNERDPHMRVDEIVARVSELSERGKLTRLVVITGGEPLRQKLGYLVRALAGENFQIQIETAGTYWQDCCDYEEVVLVCSPKTAAIHPKIQQTCKHWKYVIKDSETNFFDGLPSKSTQPLTGNKYLDSSPARPEAEDVTVWLQPCDEYDEERNVRNLNSVRDIALRFGYRVSLQLHKLLDVE